MLFLFLETNLPRVHVDVHTSLYVLGSTGTFLNLHFSAPFSCIAVETKDKSGVLDREAEWPLPPAQRGLEEKPERVRRSPRPCRRGGGL